MRDDERLAFAAAALVDGGGADEADALEAVVYDHDLALTRFTKSAIHQNLAESGVTVAFRAVAGGRAGTASTNAREPALLAAARARAVAQARFAPEPSVPVTLPDPAEYAPPSGAYDPGTAAASAELRAEAARTIFAAAARGRMWAAGFVSTQRGGIAIANTNGVRAAFDATSAAINVKCIGEAASGFAEARGRAFGALDPGVVAERAARKAQEAGTPQVCDTGDWTVVLEPAALGELLHYLLPHFSAERVHEGASFVADGLGKRYAGENVGFVDDFAHPLHAGRPFDAEGTPTQRLALLENGVARGLLTDREWSARLHVPNTGHFSPEEGQPQARYPVLLPGTRSREELVASTRRGILISRFWYIRPLDQRKTIVTGMTRDGTFLIEDGKVSKGLRNLRFNAAILELLQACVLSSEQVLTGGYSYQIVVPAARFERFRFTSVTAF